MRKNLISKIRSGFHKPTKTHESKKKYNRSKEKAKIKEILCKMQQSNC